MAGRSGQGYLGMLKRKRGLMKYDVMDLPGNAFAEDSLPYERPRITPSPFANRPTLSGPAQPDTLQGLRSGWQAMPDYPAPSLQPEYQLPKQIVDVAELPYSGQGEMDTLEAPPVETTASRIKPEIPAGYEDSTQPSRNHVETSHGFGSPLALSLLSAGLGILANNTGHYGKAGPAIGRGGLQGLSTFMQLKQQQQQEDRARQQMAMERERQQAYMQQVRFQGQKMQMADAADTRRQAIVREMLNYPEASPEHRMLMKRWMMEMGQVPASEKISAQRAANKAQMNDMPVNDDEGNPITAPDGRVLWRRTTVDPKTGEANSATYWKGNIPQRPEDVAAKELAKENVQSIAKENDMQRSRVNALDAIGYAEQMLDEGIYSGSLANINKSLAKGAGAIFGSDTSKASRTEQFRSYVGDVVIPNLKALGVAPTDTDLVYLRSVMAEDVTLEEETLRKVLARVKKKIERESGQHKTTIKQLQEDMRVPNNMRPNNQIKPPAARYKEWGIRGQ